MSNGENKTQHTQHAFLVAWVWFGEHIGLPQRFQALHLKQKHYHHTPKTKVLEFLVSIFGGWSTCRISAWQLKKCPYPLDVALERFYTGQTLKHSALFHFGTDRVTEDLPGWFKKFNGRQIIEAGIKESKQVFYLHHIKVRSEPAIYLQECFCPVRCHFHPLGIALVSRSSTTC